MSQIIRRNQHFCEWVKESLSADEVAECRRLVDEFSREDEDDIASGFPDIPQDLRAVKQCFLMFRDALREARREAQLSSDARLWEELDASRDRVRQRDMEISILLSKIQGLKDAMSQKKASYCADELRLNIDSTSQTSLTGTGSETSTPSHRTESGHPSTANSIYQKYSPEERQAFKMFASEQHATSAKVRALKAKLTLKSRELKELASRAERSQEKSRNLGKMLESFRANESARREPSFEVGLLDRMSQEEGVREDSAVNLRQVKNEIVALREAIEGEQMRLLSRFKQWRLAADNSREDACAVDTASQRGAFEDSWSVSSCATGRGPGDHGDGGTERCDASVPPVRDEDAQETIFDELKIGMGDVHSRTPYAYQKHGVSYSHLVVVPNEGGGETTSARSGGTLYGEDYAIGADALAKLRELTTGMEHIERLETPGPRLMSTDSLERDVAGPASFCSPEEPCSAPSGPSSVVITDGERDATSLRGDLDSHQLNDNIWDQHLGEKRTADTDETNIEIDDMVLTGDPEVDEEVMNFYRARNKLFL